MSETSSEIHRNDNRKRLGPRRWLRHLGPGLLVTAAFIGPGTVTKATTAGANYGFTLLWAVAFSVGATIIFQEMAARLGIVTGSGLGEAIHQTISHPISRMFSVVLVVAAIVVGNAAYQAGNIAGAAVGISSITSAAPSRSSLAVAIGGISWTCLLFGHYRYLQRILVGLVVTMSCVFLATAASLSIDWSFAVDRTLPTNDTSGRIDGSSRNCWNHRCALQPVPACKCFGGKMECKFR